MNSLKFSSFAGLLALLSIVATAPAGAEETQLGTTGSFTSPSESQRFVDGDTVQFTVAGLDDWYAVVTCENSASSTSDVVTSLSPTLPAVNETSEDLACLAKLFDSADTKHDDVAYVVEPSPLEPNEVRDPVVRPERFYPLVRDGFRDTTDLRFSVRRLADVTVRITNADGRVIRTRVLDRRSGDDATYSRRWMSWNGRKDDGTVVAEGRYRITITSTADGYRTATARVDVDVATGWRRVDRTRRFDPWLDSVDDTRGNCFTREHSYPYGNHLDCWGGAYAQAVYRVRLPGNAKVDGWWANGQRTCCDRGRLTKTGQRVSPTLFRVTVRVTNWRGFVVTRVGVDYHFRKRI